MRTFKISLLALLAMGFFASCERSSPSPAVVPENNDLILGSWTYNKVTFKRDVSAHQEDYTDLYKGDGLEVFTDSMRMVIRNPEQPAEKLGTWKLRTITATYTGRAEQVKVLHGVLTNQTTQEAEAVYWENIRFGEEKMIYWILEDGGTYEYELLRD
ncbi:MAG: hypothetical protein AAF694_07775 [Bacteroidota bacterium]